MVSSQEGAVFRINSGSGGTPRASSGFGVGSSPDSEAAWRLFMKQPYGNGWEAVGRMQRRPSSEEIEIAFYNASAAKSPLAQGAKFLRDLTQKKKA